jgi:predicted ATP-grasp superfamily ATP-dependent carboligase
MTPRYCILLTCIGGVYARDTIEALRLDRELDLRIVGCDADADVVNRFFVDAFRQVPAATVAPEEFVRATLEVCVTEGVNLVIPCGDEEVLAIARAREDFAAAGVACAVEDLAKLEIVRDKAGLFDRLRTAGVAVPRFARVGTAGDLEIAASMLDYPARSFVLKPSTGRGARGLTLVDAGVSGPVLAGSRGQRRGSLESITAALESDPPTSALIAMEYLGGAAYDVDCVATSGVPHCIVVRRRLWRDPLSPVSQGCRIERHEALEQRTREIAAVLSFNFAFDLDFGTGVDGTVGLFELNPRWSGAVASALGGGVNIPALLVRSIRGMALPAVDVQSGRCMFPVTRMAFVEGTRVQPVAAAEQR